MITNFEINLSKIDKIKKITPDEKEFRIKNLELFKASGFPGKNFEDWKFSDFKSIVESNFNELQTKEVSSKFKELEMIKSFDHNYIFLINGNFHSSNFDFEEKNKITINSHDKSSDYKIIDNPLVCLNRALAENGYFLEVEKNYKFKKVLVIYNFFTKDIKNIILNTQNKIKVNENSELHTIEYTINEASSKFISNTYEDVVLEKNSIFKNLIIQSNKSDGIFHKFLKTQSYSNSEYTNLNFSSGLKFNKLDIECNLINENCKCNILSALFLDDKEHQEIKTRINHLAPNCKSYQRVKKVLDSESKGVFQGKIYVKDIAQKTDAYQLSKALLINDNSEFNSKPELEIYADDVKCSHGSTSGSVDEDALHYLMTRGLNKKDSTKLLIKGFLNDVIEFIKNPSIKKFVEDKIEDQINGY